MTPNGFDVTQLTRDYGDPFEEARACRRECALFDFSFVARASVKGPGALSAIEHLTRRPLHRLAPGQVRYALREGEGNVLISDLTIWRHSGTHYEVMSGRRQDIGDLASAAQEDIGVQELSGETAIFSLQGPRSFDTLKGLADMAEIARLAYFTHCRAKIAGIDCIVGRLGYTGELGLEIVLPRARATELWGALVERARPAGFAAADILRIEAGFVLFANEFRIPVTACEAGLARYASSTDNRQTPEIALVCFRAQTNARPVLWQPGNGPKRPGRPGTIAVTSACHSHLANGTLGLGFARQSDISAGRNLIDLYGTFEQITLVSLPFYDPEKKRPRVDGQTASL